MKRLLGSLVLFLLVGLAYPLQAQTYSLGIGAAFEPSSEPRSSGVLQYINGSGDTRPYTSITMRPIGITGVTFSASAGLIKKIVSNEYVILESFAQAGVATSQETTSGIFNGGGSLVFPIKNGFDVVVSGSAVAAPIIDGWQAGLTFGLRYNFNQ